MPVPSLLRRRAFTDIPPALPPQDIRQTLATAVCKSSMRLYGSKLAAATAVALLILLSAQSCRAVRIGDEQYANDVGGVFYVFSDMAIHIVDPSNLTAVKVIREDQDGQPLSNEGANGGSASTSRSWNDAVLAQDSSRSLSYLFVNEGDVYPGPGNGTHSYVTVIDTNAQTIVARVSVSPRPVHIYAIDLTQEVWTHSDTDGTFDIFSVDSPSQLNTSNVPGLVADGGHGKLLVDEYLFPNSYATNVNEQFLHLLDLEDRVRLAAFDFSETIPDCAGTHSIVYSNISQHAYVECVNGGVFEWDTVTNKLVHFFANVTGYVTAALGDDWIVAADGPNNIATLLQPQGNGERSRIAYSVSIPGNPQHPVFYSNASSGRAEGLSSYTMFFPLADDTNLANLATGADVSSSEYLEAPSDCTYAASSSNSDTGRSLATGSNGQAVTPDCGACAAGFSPFDASLFNASASGMRYITLPAIEGNASRGLIGNSTFLSAGASKPTVANSSDANECSFGETYRTGKRGGQYIGLTADIPYSALFIIDASAAGGPTVVGTVNTSSNPSTLSWVPNNPPADDDTILGSY